MNMENEIQIINTQEVENLVIELRGQKVLLDRDVAMLYGVETKHVNQAVKNNSDKFPERYCFALQVSEKQYVVKNFDRMKVLKKSSVEPRAFTEGGLYMLATILKSPRATGTTIAIIEAFTKMRECSRNIYADDKQESIPQQEALNDPTNDIINKMLDMQSRQMDMLTMYISNHMSGASNTIGKPLCKENTCFYPGAEEYRQKVYALCDQIVTVHGNLQSRRAVLSHIYNLMAMVTATPGTSLMGVDWEEEKASFEMDYGYVVVSRLGMLANREENYPAKKSLIDFLTSFLDTFKR